MIKLSQNYQSLLYQALGVGSTLLIIGSVTPAVLSAIRETIGLTEDVKEIKKKDETSHPQLYQYY